MIHPSELDQELNKRLESAFYTHKLENIEKLNEEERSAIAYQVRLALDDKTDLVRTKETISQHALSTGDLVLAYILYSRRLEVPSASLYEQMNKLIPRSNQ